MALIKRNTAVNEDDDTNVVAVEVSRSEVKLTVTEGAKVAEFTFARHEWLDFIVGTFDIPHMLDKIGLWRLLRVIED